MKKMRSVVRELADYVTDKDLNFLAHHQGCDGEMIGGEHLRRFLSATMDEVRLRYASTFAIDLLRRTDLADAEHFLSGLLRREITQFISYPKQRDHFAHTVYNYLMGWYIYDHSSLVQHKLSEHFSLRNEPDSLAGFRDLWPFVSLLHDVGYLFEGSLSALSTDTRSDHGFIGAAVVREYYQHRFWMDSGVDSVHSRKRLLDLSGVTIPDYTAESMTGISDSLRYVGNLDRLTAAVRRERHGLGLDEMSQLSSTLPGDAFDLWELYYSALGLDGMINRLKSLRLVFHAMMTQGLGDTRIRVLDHGVCGGLLLLQYSSFYFTLHFGLVNHLPTATADEALCKTFLERASASGEYSAQWWWQGIIWATAAVALHNVQQQSGLPADCNHPGPLSIDEDPLTYLGVLVDCLQEWDRYTVSREPVIGGTLPTQGIDVSLGAVGGKVRIRFESSKTREKVSRALNTSLAGWEEIVDLK